MALNRRNIKRGLQRLKRASPKVAYVLSEPSFQYAIDNPQSEALDSREVVVEGWLLSKNGVKLRKLRARNNQKSHNLTHGLTRPDVARAFPDYDPEVASKSGFSGNIEYEDGSLIIEADFGKGYVEIARLQIRYAPEKLVVDLLNPRLTQNMAEHINLLENNKKYFYEKEQSVNYSPSTNDPRLIATYLPQFHPIEENNTTWGKGFTEWTNVTAAQARFVGHQQPFLPSDLGFYDLRMESKIAEQIALAKKYGVYGFCFYYYWFSGHKLLERPIETVLKHNEWDFNFVICWANENWTKRWDGRNNDVIIAQRYLEEDPLNFIKDVESILTDLRYVTEDGKPVLMVYRASELKDPERYAKVWREYFHEKYKRELHLVSFISFDDKDPRSYGFDASLDFAPLGSFFKTDKFPEGRYPLVDVSESLLDKNFAGQVVEYRDIALNTDLDDSFKFPAYKCVMPSWDNDARKKGKGFVYKNANPDIYASWLDRVLEQETNTKTSPLVFINAWNEWAEGAVLEPSAHLGHAVLRRTSEIMSKYATETKNRKNLPMYNIQRNPNTKLAVLVHLYYPERWEFIKEKLDNLNGVDYDLFVTLNDKYANWEEKIRAFRPNTSVYITPNRGRDVLPFVHFARRISSAGYEIILKLHSKKSTHRDDGNDWFEDIVTNLLPSNEQVKNVVRRLHEQPAIVGPGGHLVSLARHMGSNENALKHILTKLYDSKKADDILRERELYPFFGGTMFWVSLKAVQPILDLYLMPEDFESEHGQIDGTIAHALERAFCIIAKISGGEMLELTSNGMRPATLEDTNQQYKYAP